MTSAERLKEYEDLFARSQAYNPAQFQAGFEKDYGEATNYNKDLIDQRAAVIGEMQSLPAQLRSQYATSGIRNPLEQEALIAQRRGVQTADLNRLTDFLAARRSKYEDVLGKYLQGYLADQSAAERAAENAWRMYQDVLAQEEAEKSRRAAAAQQAALGDLFRQYASQGGDLDITVGEEPKKKTWTSTVESAVTKPISQSTVGKTLGLNLPDWIATTPYGTLTNLMGNLLGNIQVPKRESQSFWDKLFNR